LAKAGPVPAINHQPSAVNLHHSIARWKIGNIGNIVVNQQVNRQQIGNRPATFLERLKRHCSQCEARIFGFWRGFGEGA